MTEAICYDLDDPLSNARPELLYHLARFTVMTFTYFTEQIQYLVFVSPHQGGCSLLDVDRVLSIFTTHQTRNVEETSL